MERLTFEGNFCDIAVFCHRRIHSIFAVTGRQNERATV